METELRETEIGIEVEADKRKKPALNGHDRIQLYAHMVRNGREIYNLYYQDNEKHVLQCIGSIFEPRAICQVEGVIEPCFYGDLAKILLRKLNHEEWTPSTPLEMVIEDKEVIIPSGSQVSLACISSTGPIEEFSSP